MSQYLVTTDDGKKYRVTTEDKPSQPISIGNVAKQAVTSAVSPLALGEQNVSMRMARGWQGLKPETQRSLGYLATSTMFPAMAGEAAESAGLPLLLKTLMRGGAGAAGSALADVGTGHRISNPNMAITAGTEGMSGAIEGAGRAMKPYIPEMAEKFARIKKPVLDIAEKYGTKFKTTFPGTTEAIEKGSGQVNKYFNDIAEKTKGVRERLYNASTGKVAQSEAKYAADMTTHEKTVEAMKNAYKQAKQQAISDRDKSFITAHEEALSKHAQNIKGLSSELEGAAHNLQKSGADLRTAGFKRGINVDPIEELQKAKIGPAIRGNKHELALALPARLPSEIEPLEVRLKQYLQVSKSMLPKDSLIEAVRLKRAFQDLKHVQGGLGYAENEAVNAYLNTLEKHVISLDPEYHGLETAFHQAKTNYDRVYDKSKKIFDSLQQGEEIGIPREMLPKSVDFKPAEVPEPQYPNAPQKPGFPTPKLIKPSGLEGRPYGATSGETQDVIYRAMHPGEGSVGKSKEILQRIDRAPGSQQAMGNIAAKDLGNVFNRGMLYPLALGAGAAIGTPMAMAKAGKGKGFIGGLGSTFALAGLVRAALQSPALYRTIVTNPELVKAIVTKVPWAAKIFVAGKNANPNP